MKLPDDDAKRMAHAINDVSKHYKLPVLAPDKLALASLIFAFGKAYVRMGVRYMQEQDGKLHPAAPSGPPPGKGPIINGVAEPAPPPPPPNDWFSADAASQRH